MKQNSYDDEITLVTRIQNGKEIKEEKVNVYAEKKGINRSEFYGAQAVGLTASAMFAVHKEDFELSKKTIREEKNITTVYASGVEHEGNTYNILRAFEKEDGEIEITCS